MKRNEQYYLRFITKIVNVSGMFLNLFDIFLVIFVLAASDSMDQILNFYNNRNIVIKLNK